MTVRDTLKKSMASQVQANQLKKEMSLIEIEVTSATYPEKKRHHWVRVMVPRTSNKGLVRSTFSLFGTRFRKK